ncbi:MAG TPA: glycoside hydrolase family 2 TIM barrel-domain containing protein, partial [Hanamia sp.]|nr:glycoside hydrolase family 2 TIM barrel-domain containing protein [Hanamia sp.]
MKKVLTVSLLVFISFATKAQYASLLANVHGRQLQSLNGKWEVIVDPFNGGAGSWKSVWKDQKPSGRYDFYEYGFIPSVTLQVPGDWNHQKPQLTYYEGTIWYKKTFMEKPNKDKRAFLYFGAVNYQCDVYFNNQYLGSHEGGFTPFQFEITGKLKDTNSVIVRVNNQRKADEIPALNFDWWNYGGITRDVSLIETPANYIKDYSVQLAKNRFDTIAGWIELGGNDLSEPVSISIPKLHLNYHTTTGTDGKVFFQMAAKPQLWSPAEPKLYDVMVSSKTDTIHEMIGFRTIQVKGTEILLNGKPVLLKGINIHEEIPQEKRRAYSEADAEMLLKWAKDLGCNFVRLTHYSHNEYMVRLADKWGIMLWEEVPLWQNIQFSNPEILNKADTMLKEMITRDKNRCSIIMWSLSNETSPSVDRNKTLTSMAGYVRSLDGTRLVTSAINHVRFDANTITIDDSLCKVLDVVGVNEYLGWYVPWPAKPENMVWKNPYNKPLIMSEFGAEAKYGQHGSPDTNGFWAEERQAQVFKDQITMLKNIPFLRGTCPWVLADFRSETRLQPIYQQGWNRKGLLSDKGQKKQAW